jgi:hypothetical protein
MPVKDGRASERHAEDEQRDCQPPRRNWPEGDAA